MTNTKFAAFAAALLSTCALTAPAGADDFSDTARRAWLARSQMLVEAAHSDHAETESYVEQLKSACAGVIGEAMANRMPNWAGIQVMSFCTGVKDLDRTLRAKGGQAVNNSYCGDFNQTIKTAARTPQTPDYADILEGSQKLAAAAEHIRSLSFELHHKGFMDLNVGKERPYICK
jgi:hypothetical protein